MAAIAPVDVEEGEVSEDSAVSSSLTILLPSAMPVKSQSAIVPETAVLTAPELYKSAVVPSSSVAVILYVTVSPVASDAGVALKFRGRSVWKSEAVTEIEQTVAGEPEAPFVTPVVSAA